MEKLITTTLILILLSGYTLSDNTRTDTGEYRLDNIRIYENTPVWELAQAVKGENTAKITKIAKKYPDLLDYQDPLYGSTLLFWSVAMEKYDSAKTLLKAGADPNIISTYQGGTALYRAANYSYIDSDYKQDAKYVKLLLKYGANPNIGFVGNNHDNMTEIGTTPLMNSIGCGIEKTKALVEGGADINYTTPIYKKTATSKSIRQIGSSSLPMARYAHYLIVEKKAKITEPYYPKYSENPTEKYYPVNDLRWWYPKLDSEEYKLKMEIIDEFARQGVNYWETEIPPHILERIKELYPDTWTEYIKKY